MLNHGCLERHDHTLIGVNSRLDTIQAAVLRVKLKYFNEAISNRQILAHYYTENLGGIPDHLKPPIENKEYRSAWAQYTILLSSLSERDSLVKRLQEKGIEVSIFYPTPLHLQKCFSHLGYKGGDLPVCESVCNRVLSLPLYPDLTRAEQDYIISQIKSFFGNDKK